MTRFSISARARQDILRVYDSDRRVGGTSLAEASMSQLDSIFTLIANTPRMGRRLYDDDDAARFHTSERFIILYRDESKMGSDQTARIVRVHLRGENWR